MPIKGHLLLVEDDAASRNALGFLLKRAGWRVEPVSTIAEAKAAIAKSVPDALVLDLMLPDGDGSAVLVELWARNAQTHTVVTTGVNDSEWIARVLAMGPHLMLRKPIDISMLLKFLDS